MLVKFKSRATGDLIMLEPNGRRVLEIIGKSAQSKGIILPKEMAGAIRALELAIEHEEPARRMAVEDARNNGRPMPTARDSSFRQRALPLLDMLEQSRRADEEIVWQIDGIY